MCKSERTQKPLEDVMGNLSPFISNKMLVVYMYIAFGQKLWHKDCSLLCNKTVLMGSTLET